MSITFQAVGANAANTGAATTLNVPYPAGISAGDLMVLQVGCSSTTAITLPSGWTSAATGTAGGSSPIFLVAVKVATGSETGNLAVTTPNFTSQGRILLFRGVDQTTPLDVAATSFSSSTATLAYNIATMTTVTNGAMLVYYGMGNSATGNWTEPTNPAAFTEVWDNNSAIPKGTGGYLLQTTAGATGTVNLASTTSTRGGAAMIALRPASTSSVTGTLAVTLDGATLAASGTESISGSLASTLAGATLAAAGTVTNPVTGTLASTLAGATFAATGTERIIGSLAVSLGGATLTVTARETFTGTLASTLSGATLTGVGVVTAPVTGTLTVTLAGATLVGAGVTFRAVTGTLAVTLDDATLNGAGNTHAPFRDIKVLALVDMSRPIPIADVTRDPIPLETPRELTITEEVYA